MLMYVTLTFTIRNYIIKKDREVKCPLCLFFCYGVDDSGEENVMKMHCENENCIEHIILEHGSRGMDILREHLPADYCKQAAEALYKLERGNIILTTGFYVVGFTETDGPVGTLTLALALKKLGFNPYIFTDIYSKDCFECYGVETVYVPLDADDEYFAKQLDIYKPVGIISIERCGRNLNDDYANMRGISIKEYTAPMDGMFEIAAARGILTIGVGDGGNEIGMGNLKDVIKDKLSLNPCCTKVDYLVIATVSNWGAYGITGYLSRLADKELMEDFGWAVEYLKYTNTLGSLDGVSHKCEVAVDGLPIEYEKEVWESVRLV